MDFRYGTFDTQELPGVRGDVWSLCEDEEYFYAACPSGILRSTNLLEWDIVFPITEYITKTFGIERIDEIGMGDGRMVFITSSGDLFELMEHDELMPCQIFENVYDSANVTLSKRDQWELQELLDIGLFNSHDLTKLPEGQTYDFEVLCASCTKKGDLWIAAGHDGEMLVKLVHGEIISTSIGCLRIPIYNHDKSAMED